MIRRRSKRDLPQPASAPEGPIRAPSGPPNRSEANTRTTQQPALPPGRSSGGPSGEVEPSEQVLDELLTFFGMRHGTTATKEAPATQTVATAAATRVIGPDEVDVEPLALPPPASPGLDDLVPSPTKRSTRRSAREAKREEKQAAKRLAQHAKDKAKADKAAAKRARRSGRGKSRRHPGDDAGAGEVGVGSTDGAAGSAGSVDVLDDQSDGFVRVLPGPSPAPADAGPPPPTVGQADRPTVSIVDAGDLPDAVYLEGDLGVDGGVATPAGRPTVFIDDKDPATGAIVSMDVATSAARIEPRLRDRRIAVKRAVGRKRLKWIAVVVCAIGVVVGALAVLGSGLFEIKHVTVDGAVYSVGPDLDAVIAELQGTNVLRVDTDRAEQQLESIPWVADARVTTDFPNGATIEIAERSPVVAYQGQDGRFRVIDSRGRVLDITDGQPVDYMQLVVEADEARNLDPGAFAPVGYRAAATLVPALGAPLRQQVESVSAAADGSDLRLTLTNGIEVRFGEAEDLVGKLVRLQTALTDPDPEMAPTEMIDVSTQDYVVR